MKKNYLNFGKENVKFSAMKNNNNTISNRFYSRLNFFNPLIEKKCNEIMKEELRKIV
jgi:hypothetical protein